MSYQVVESLRSLKAELQEAKERESKAKVEWQLSVQYLEKIQESFDKIQAEAIELQKELANALSESVESLAEESTTESDPTENEVVEEEVEEEEVEEDPVEGEVVEEPSAEIAKDEGEEPGEETVGEIVSQEDEETKVEDADEVKRNFNRTMPDFDVSESVSRRLAPAIEAIWSLEDSAELPVNSARFLKELGERFTHRQATGILKKLTELGWLVEENERYTLANKEDNGLFTEIDVTDDPFFGDEGELDLETLTL